MRVGVRVGADAVGAGGAQAARGRAQVELGGEVLAQVRGRREEAVVVRRDSDTGEDRHVRAHFRRRQHVWREFTVSDVGIAFWRHPCSPPPPRS